MPTFGSLFAGIGGIDLGLERAGWTGRWQVEYEPFCQRVLAKHWPDVPRYGDIKDVDWSTVEPVDLIAGGFPCQPFSVAGRQRRLDDDRWLWPEFARCVRELRPRYVLVENVPGLLVGGGMDAVLGGLADLGYDTEWESVPAAAVGAPHLRYRVWIIATRTQLGRHVADPDYGRPLDAVRTGWDAAWDGSADVAHANGSGPQGYGRLRGPWDGPSQRLARSRRDAIQGQWSTEPDVGRVAHGVPARVDRLRALGNAVVPQVVEFIGRRILEAEAEAVA
jgi:DNA (cytosine-5)-methyltransferase 1